MSIEEMNLCPTRCIIEDPVGWRSVSSDRVIISSLEASGRHDAPYPASGRQPLNQID
jgi:hypothetical protein